jgi:hypothetical protein
VPRPEQAEKLAILIKEIASLRFNLIQHSSSVWLIGKNTETRFVRFLRQPRFIWVASGHEQATREGYGDLSVIQMRELLKVLLATYKSN